MRIAIPLAIVLIIASQFSFAQGISGTWHGFQTALKKGDNTEYRITVDLQVKDENVTGTMQLKSPAKGVITSSLTGKVEGNLIYLNESGILTEGVSTTDAKLCRYVLKIGKNSLHGKGRSSFKGYDHLRVTLQRGEVY
jgi:hypothetical protein